MESVGSIQQAWGLMILSLKYKVDASGWFGWKAGGSALSPGWLNAFLGCETKSCKCWAIHQRENKAGKSTVTGREQKHKFRLSRRSGKIVKRTNVVVV